MEGIRMTMTREEYESFLNAWKRKNQKEDQELGKDKDERVIELNDLQGKKGLNEK